MMILKKVPSFALTLPLIPQLSLAPWLISILVVGVKQNSPNDVSRALPVE